MSAYAESGSLTMRPETLSEGLILLATIHPATLDCLYSYAFDVPRHHFDGMPIEKKIRHIMKALDQHEEDALDRLERAMQVLQECIEAS